MSARTNDGDGDRSSAPAPPTDFIRAKVADDLATGKYGGRVVTRFPPEPNGFLHIGHAKAICLNFGLARETEGGRCHLRFDDTNPTTEDMAFVESIQSDIRWLGFDWDEHLYFASDYFEQLYAYAVHMIEAGKAYVCSLSESEIREYRGTVREPGRNSPYRDRSVEENLDLFARMRAGEFDDGAHVLRARIDMAAPNMIMRDPLLYRIRRAHHYRTGDTWCIYPLYDFAHCLSDAIERVTHSLCSLEFKDNRELYDWVLDAVDSEPPRPEQTEFARLNLDYTVLSKRKLIRLVREKHVTGWDDPRMPTMAGLRRRGVPPDAIRAFCDLIGVARVDSRVDIGKLEYCIRDHLNTRVPRVMAVLRPLRVVITNYPEDQVEHLDAPYYPHDVPLEGSRVVPFTRELYIERDDFRSDPPKNYFRLAPGREVRLRYGYFITCQEVITDPSTGEVTEVRCTYDPATKGGNAPDGRKVKGTLHWVSAAHALPAEVRLYDRLFNEPDPDAAEDFVAALNPDSVIVLAESRVEPSVATDEPGTRYQFERQGYFCSDPIDSRPDRLVFNRVVGLRDTWAKISGETTGAGRKPRRGVKKSTVDRSPVTRTRESEAPAAGAGTPSPGVTTRRDRYMSEFALGADEATVIAGDRWLTQVFDEAVQVHPQARDLANWIVNDVVRERNDRGRETLGFTGQQLGRLVALVDEGTISRTIARDILGEMATEGGDPRDIVTRRGLQPVNDASAIQTMVDEVLAAHPEEVARYRGGRTGLAGFFVGQVIRRSRGAANPEIVKSIVQQTLE